MNYRVVWAVTLRHLRTLRRDINLFLMWLYWPLLDVLTWGFLGAWIQHVESTVLPHYKIVALLGVLLWQFVGRSFNVMVTTFTEELWSYNIVNLFSSPLTIIEWSIGMILFTLLMTGVTLCVGLLWIKLLYGISIMTLIPHLLLFAPPLIISGFWLGFTCLQIVVTLGKRGIELSYIIGWFFLPFCGAYYPIKVLPLWAQQISAWLPMTHVFESMRAYIMHGQNPTDALVRGYTMALLYTALAVIGFVHCFRRSKQRGLARLAD